jgi:hypothetical protein
MTKAERNHHRRVLRDRVDHALSGIVDVAERIIDELRAPQPALPTPPLAVARRQLSNTLRLSQFCDNKTCQRARCCRGEPLHCLQIAIPLLPPEAFENLLRKQSGRAAKRQWRAARAQA